MTTIVKTDGNALDNLFKHSNSLATLENMQTGGAWQNDDMARAIETETPGQVQDRAKKQVRALMNVARFRSVRSVVSPIMLRLTSMLGVTDATSQAMMVGQTGNPFARMGRNIMMSQKGMVDMVARGLTADQGAKAFDMARMDNRIHMRALQGMSTQSRGSRENKPLHTESAQLPLPRVLAGSTARFADDYVDGEYGENFPLLGAEWPEVPGFAVLPRLP